MTLTPILASAVAAGCYAGAAGMLYTVGPRHLANAFVCGFAARLARDLLMDAGVTQNWATVVAAAVVVLVGMTTLRRHPAPLVVIATAVLPLAAAVPMLKAIVGLMNLSNLQGEPLAAATIALGGNLSKFFTTTLAIAVGLAAGLAILRLFSREEAVRT
jgi:uncharacterized membrane protein YjjB (DUF3815 family)